ncbi:MarR family transcriptional regulator [bacterium]|nr:MarR family transcriptional regulator [bacterium]
MNKNTSIDSLFFDLDQASRICRLFGAQNFKKSCKYDLVFDEFLILDYVSQNPDCCQIDLTNALLKGKSHVSKILNQLEEKEYIERIQDTKNNRIIKKIVITDKGYTIFKNTEKQMKKILSVIEQTLDKSEVERCRKFLKEIKNAIKSTNYINLD